MQFGLELIQQFPHYIVLLSVNPAGRSVISSLAVIGKQRRSMCSSTAQRYCHCFSGLSGM